MKTGIRIVYNRLLGGWYVVRGPHQTPLNGRFNSKEEAQAWLRARQNPLKKGYSRRTISKNIRREVKRGYPVKRAAAMSYRSAKKSFKRRHKGKQLPAYLARTNPARGSVDEIAAHELFQFAIQDENLYRQRIGPVVLNLRKKVKKQIYQPHLALKLWKYVADDAAKRYTHGGYGRGSGYGIFNVPTRMETARLLQNYYQGVVMQTNPRKRRRRNPVRRDAAARSIRTTGPHPTRYVARRSGLTPRTAQAARMGLRRNPRRKKRSVKRRKTQSSLPIRLQILRGKTWETMARYKDAPAQIKNAKQDANRYARFYKTKARVVRV